MLGSDYPYDMAMMVAETRGLKISDADKTTILQHARKSCDGKHERQAAKVAYSDGRRHRSD